MSYEDTVKALKIISNVTLGQFAGASVYGALAVQPALIEQDDVQGASKVMRSLLHKSAIMPVSSLLCSASSLAVYFKTRGTPMEDVYWLVTGGVMFGLLPYTIALILPINSQFRDSDETFSNNDKKWSELLSDWLTFHTPRAVISLTLFTVGVYKLVSEK